MLKAYAAIWREIGDRLASLPFLFKNPPPEGTPNVTTLLLYDALNLLESNCEELGLVSAVARVRELRGKTQNHVSHVLPQAGTQEIMSDLLELERSISHELEAHKFFYVAPVKVAYYESQRPFGEKVGDRFPLAQTDIEEGAKCLALGRDTACAFHMMRVCEHGLKAVASTLGISKQRDWGRYIQEINGVIHHKPLLKGVKWPRDTAFYEDVTGDIEAIKLAWRNPGIHIEREYRADESVQVFAAVKVFMDRLASKLPGPKAFR